MAAEPTDSTELRRILLRDGFAFLDALAMRGLLDARIFPDWPAFAASWSDLAIDTYLLERGLHRRRRHAVFGMSNTGAIERLPHQPHYQSPQYNALQGGIERRFEPIQPAIADGCVLSGILHFCASIFGGAANASTWRIEVHQFRIESHQGEFGQPTPEGVHRDGVDYVLVLLVARENIASGTTTIHALDGQTLGSFTLTQPLDAALVDDTRVAHGVTPVHAIDPQRPAYRDVLVVTFKRDTASA